MYKHFSKELLIKLLIVFTAVGITSCGSTKKLKYFQDIPDSTKLSYIKLGTFTPAVIHPGDLLDIQIYVADASATSGINAISAAAPTAVGSNVDYQPNGFLVDKDGNVNIPQIGKVAVSNLTVEQIQAIVKLKADVIFNDAVVIVKNTSFRITFIGEFQRPGTSFIQRPKLSIIDAIGLVGGLTDFGRRDDIILFRQNDDNTMSTIKINLLNTAILKSPYYYLKSNDVLIANPNRSKGIATDQEFNRYLTLYSLLGSVLTTVLLLLKR